MYTTTKVRRALQEMADDDFVILLDELPPEAREAVIDDAGRHDQALQLVRPYDETRSLGTLVELVRMIAPSTSF